MAIMAVTDKKGYFKQNDWGVLLLKITNSQGYPVDPEEITCNVVKGSESVDFDSNIPMQVAEGCYVLEWVIDEEQEIGEYVATWDFVIDGEDYSEEQTIIITTGTDIASAPILYDERLIAFREALEKMINAIQEIPIYMEQAKPSRDRQTFYFSFPRWNQSSRVKIYRNKQIINDGININYFRGSVTFEEVLLPQDIVNADYDFRWFSDDDLDQFLNNSLQAFNSFPPYGTYSLLNVPNAYMTVILYGAAKDALRNIMLGIQNQEKALVFGNREQSQQTFSNMETLKQNYEKDWDKLTEQKKYGRYPSIKLNVVPEYTLPGGRSRWFRYLFK